MKQFWDLIESNLGADFAEDPDIQETVHALSHAFTEGREELPRDYLNDPELQAAYLAYFVPLNFEKLYMLLSSHAGVWPSELATDRAQRWCDLGCGPGTAALAALAAYKNRYRKLEKLPLVEIDLVDRQTGALNLAEILVKDFAKKLGLEVSVRMLTELPLKPGPYDLSLAANVLNELPAEEGTAGRELLQVFWEATSGVLLLLEPGHRVSSQRLVRFRERLLKASGSDVRILGPCPHQEKCPVHRTKHWCHFAEPVTDGRLIDLNLRIFKDPRGWLKFSYLLARRAEPLPREEGRFRAIGDLHLSGPKNLAIDLCQPNEKFSLRVPTNIPPELASTLVRGATVWVDKDRKITARPLTKRELGKLPALRRNRERPEPQGKPAPRPHGKRR